MYLPFFNLEIVLGLDGQIKIDNTSIINDGIDTSNSLKVYSTTLNNSYNSFHQNDGGLTLGPDRTVNEGTNITLSGIIKGAISIPSNSVTYSWKQIDGPKLDLKEEDKQKKVLRFVAPNLPNDTKYSFELNAIQKKDNNENINLGPDSINILVIDTNKVAKNIERNIPVMPNNGQDFPGTSN